MVEAARIIAVPGVGAPPAIGIAIARVGIARSVVLAIGVGIELGTPARIVDDVLGRCRRGKREQQDGGNGCQFVGELLDLDTRQLCFLDKSEARALVPSRRSWPGRKTGKVAAGRSSHLRLYRG